MDKEFYIGNFLKRVKRPVKLINNTSYKLVTIKLNHKGVVLREMKKGSEIKSGMYLIKEGDFILSGIDARNGAFGIVPPELDNAIVTNDFWYFEIDEKIISKRLFLEMTATNWFDEICKRGSEGTTQRIRLQKDKFYNQKVLLPPKNRQERILESLLKFKSKKANLLSEIEHQKTLIKQLRQSILLDAVKGSLIEQNEKDEPATELLKRIKAEKEKLIKQGKIKKGKELPPITENEIPYDLPTGWAWCRGNDLFKPMESKLPTGKTFGYIDIASIDNKNHKLIEPRYIPVEKAPSRASRKVYGGSTLFSLVRPYLGNIAYIEEKYSDCIASTGFFVCTPFSDVYPKFLYYTMVSEYVVQGLNTFMKGVNSPSINTDDILNFLYPLPPLAEQKRIVEKVNEIMELCSALEKEIAHSKQEADYLLNAILRETFNSKPVREYSLNETPISIAAEP